MLRGRVERASPQIRRVAAIFAYLQGNFSTTALARHGLELDVDAIYLILAAGTDHERVLVDGAAGREIWPKLFKLAFIMRFVPLRILNLFYRAFSHFRYRLFGQYDTCRIPTAEERLRFVD